MKNGQIVQSVLGGHTVRAVVLCVSSDNLADADMAIVLCVPHWLGTMNVPQDMWRPVSANHITVQDLRALWDAWGTATDQDASSAATDAEAAFHYLYLQAPTPIKRAVDAYAATQSQADGQDELPRGTNPPPRPVPRRLPVVTTTR